MKAGLTTSLVLHTVVLGFGLFTLSSPRPMEVADVESFPVDIVPMAEFAQSVQGEREAPAAERPAPTPTTRTDVVEDAQRVGDNTVDTTAPPTPDPRPRPVETAEAPPPAPTPPTPAPEPAPEPEPQAEPERPEPVPTTEVAPEPRPQQEVAPDPVPETEVAEAPATESVSLPTSAPTPQSRPQPPQAQSARTPERREPDRQREQRQQAAASDRDSENLEDQVAALLNRDRASGGGAQRSNEQAALGGRETTGAQLTQTERDAIIAQLRSCWNVPVGAEGSSDLQTTVRFRLDPSGTLEGSPVIEKASGNRQFDESTTRAIRICSQRGFQLPSDKYNTWSEVVVNFDPRDMF
ncbi:MAG: TonB family protein [Mesorhizobium sp.]|nr:TonB family protein [Mesorhizobium sp.]